MKVTGGQNVEIGDRVRIINGRYDGQEGYVKRICDTRSNRNIAAMIVLPGRVHEMPFLGMELERV